MCVIVLKPAGIHISMDRLRECHRANPDGWGFMWAHNDELFTQKDTSDWHLFSDCFRAALDGFPKSPFVIHFRTASIGQITREACHPHMVNNRLAFAHNGNLFHFSDYFYSDKRTDSQRFCEWLSKRWCPGIIQDLERYCVSNYSKMVFMNNQGHVWICNEAAGMWENRCWFSNGGIEHYVGYGYSGAYEYGMDEIRHKGGLISIQGFSGDWKQCEHCNGWFKSLYSGLCQDCQTYKELVG